MPNCIYRGKLIITVQNNHSFFRHDLTFAKFQEYGKMGVHLAASGVEPDTTSTAPQAQQRSYKLQRFDLLVLRCQQLLATLTFGEHRDEAAFGYGGHEKARNLFLHNV